jgi:hypothetical protein
MSRVARPKCFIASLSCKLCLSFFSKLWSNLAKFWKIPLSTSKKHQIFDGKKSTPKNIFEKSGARLPIWKSQMTSYGENPARILHMSLHRNTNFVNVVIPALMWKPNATAYAKYLIYANYKFYKFEFLQVQISYESEGKTKMKNRGLFKLKLLSIEMATITAWLYLSRLVSLVAFAHLLCGEIGLLCARINPCCISFFLRLNVIFFFFRFINLRLETLIITNFRINTFLHVIFRC